MTYFWCPYTYNDVPPGTIGYARMASMQRYDGYWEKYAYDSEGRRVEVLAQHMNSSFGDTANSKKTEMIYSTSNPKRTRIVSIGGQEVARSYEAEYEYPSSDESEKHRIVCQTVGASWTAGDNLVSKTRRYDSDHPTPLLRGRTKWTEQEDGTRTIFDYSLWVEMPDGSRAPYTGFEADPIEVVHRDTGVPNSGGTAITNGIRVTTETDADGYQILWERRDIATNKVLEGWTATATDSRGRVTAKDWYDGSEETIMYAGVTNGCGSCSGIGRDLIASYTGRDGITVDYEYDALGRRVKTTRLGVTDKLVLDAEGKMLERLKEWTDPVHGSQDLQVEENHYDIAGRLVWTEDVFDERTDFAYAYPTGGGEERTTTYPSVSTGRPTRIETSYGDGRTAEISGTAVRPRKMEYGTWSGGETVKRISVGVSGSETEWTMDYSNATGRTVKTAYPDNAEMTVAYNDVGQRIRQTDPDGVTTLFAYDDRGRMIRQAVDLNGNDTIDLATDQVTETDYAVVDTTIGGENVVALQTTSKAYPTDSSSTPTTVSVSQRTADGRFSKQTSFGESTETVQTVADPGGDWTVKTTRPDDSWTVTTYEDGRMISVARMIPGDPPPTIQKTDYEYDERGRRTASIDSRTGQTDFTYDDGDRLTSQIAPDPDGAGSLGTLTTSFDYDALGRQTKVTLPDSSEVHTEYTARGEVSKTWGSQQYPVEYTYDPQGRRKTMVTWKEFNKSTGAGISGSSTTTWIYDSQRGWLDEKQYDDGKGPVYTYTDAGRLETRTWERGVVTTYGYDDAGRQTTVDYSDSTTDIEYVYDRMGRQTTVREGTLASGTISGGNLIRETAMEFDSELRLETETLDSTYFDGRILTRTYEDGTSGTVNGRPSGFELGVTADPDQDQSVGYTYDSAGRLATVSDGTDTFTYGYLADSGSLVETVEGPAHTTTWSYEPGRNAVTVVENEETVGTANIVSQYTYRYDALGRRTDRVDEGDAFAQDALYNWSYDSEGQVTSADRYLGTDPDNPGTAVTGETDSFDYDDIGNRITSTFGTASQRAYTTNILNQYTNLTNPTATPTYDDDGNMTQDGGNWWFEWNGENRLEVARDYSDPLNPPTNATRLSFSYDYQGRRIEKKVEDYDGSSWSTTSHERFIYDGWNLIARFDVSGSSLALDRAYLWGKDLSGSMQGAGGVGGLLSVLDESSGDVFYPTYDANGNVSEYLDDTGAIEAHYEYSAFGRVIHSTGSPDDFAFRFSTKYTDDETELVYYGFRYYVPETGRWLSRDPIGELGGLNLYAFVGNDGVNKKDYLGWASAKEKANLLLRIKTAIIDNSCHLEIRCSVQIIMDDYFDERRKNIKEGAETAKKEFDEIKEYFENFDDEKYEGLITKIGAVSNSLGLVSSGTKTEFPAINSMLVVFDLGSKIPGAGKPAEYYKEAVEGIGRALGSLRVGIGMRGVSRLGTHCLAGDRYKQAKESINELADILDVPRPQAGEILDCCR